MKTAAPTLDFSKLRIVPLPSPTNTVFADFRSGEPEIDKNLGKCCDWHGCYRSRVFCAYFDGDSALYGFYCLGLHAHDSKMAATLFVRPNDDDRGYVPFIYLHYLAVREGWRRKKIGTMLLVHALERCAIVIRNIGSYGVALNALNEDAIALYDNHGFRIPKAAEKMAHPTMILPAQTLFDLFGA